MATRTDRWKPTVHRVAANDIEHLKSVCPQTLKALFYTMGLLGQERYPNKPKHPWLDVCELRNAPGWYRAYIVGEDGQQHVQWRVIFRLLGERDGEIIEVSLECDIDAIQNRTVQITRLGHRLNDVYKHLKQLQSEVWG